ncbi:hypothetical protein WMW72_12050 [Paenibacillus filicis]|uniref:Uncharacterized protein n=1 Tax=Paenibacillus filicis TaxID=669464 RepID=A0ABU9DIN1_9BACL
MTLSEVKQDYIDDIIKRGLATTQKQAERLFLEALSRNLVATEILEMCAHISKEE